MRKGKYIIYGLIIWAIALATAGFSLYRFFYCLERAHLTHYFFEMFVWVIAFLIGGVGGAWLGWMQMKAPADPKPKKIGSNYMDVKEEQLKSIARLLKEVGTRNFNEEKLDYLKFKNPPGVEKTYSALIYHYWENGVKDMGRYDKGSPVFIIEEKDLFLIPTNFKPFLAKNSDKAKIWLGYCDSQSQRYDLKAFTILHDEESETGILYCGYLTSLNKIDTFFESVPEEVKAKVKSLTTEEAVELLRNYLK